MLGAEKDFGSAVPKGDDLSGREARFECAECGGRMDKVGMCEGQITSWV